MYIDTDNLTPLQQNIELEQFTIILKALSERKPFSDKEKLHLLNLVTSDNNCYILLSVR